MRLSEPDLRFIVETVATKRRDYDHIMSLLRNKDDLLEPMLEDPRLAERLFNEQEVFVRASTYLFFAVLLRRVRRDLEGQAFVLEPDTCGKRIPVFEAPQAAEFLGESALREYLIEMLCSFVRTNTGVLWWKERGAWRKRKFSDLDLDDMIALCHLVEPALRPHLYKRIADLALFLAGIYPDQATRWTRRRPAQARTVPEYERKGRQFYALAAREHELPWPASVFEGLAQKFTPARQTLNTLSDRYLKPLRERCFTQPSG